MFERICAKIGKRLDIETTLKSQIEAGGFVNIHEKVYKVPVGDWAKSPLLKEAGRYHKAQLLEGLEGVSESLFVVNTVANFPSLPVCHFHPYSLWRAHAMDARRGSSLRGEGSERSE